MKISQKSYLHAAYSTNNLEVGTAEFFFKEIPHCIYAFY